MYYPYLSYGTIKAFMELFDMFGTNTEFTTFDYYKKTGKRITGQHITDLKSSGFLRKTKMRTKNNEHPRGGVYIIPDHVVLIIDRYKFREALA